MVCGADSISDMDLLRHGGMSRLFDGVRAPSTLGTLLRLCTFGHVRQLDTVAAGLLARLSAQTPVLPDADKVVFIDIDDTVRQTYGYAEKGAGRGYAGSRDSTGGGDHHRPGAVSAPPARKANQLVPVAGSLDGRAPA